MIPEAHIVHRAPKRLRIKVASKREHEEYLRSLPERFTGSTGIEEIAINPVTGSVLFKHSGNADEIIDFMKDRGIFKIRMKSVKPPSVHKGLSSLYKDLDGIVQSLSSGSTNAGGLAFVALLAYGIVQIGRGNITGPAWYTAFWYALNIFLKSQPGEIPADIDEE